MEEDSANHPVNWRKTGRGESKAGANTAPAGVAAPSALSFRTACRVVYTRLKTTLLQSLDEGGHRLGILSG
jgi:hypothetical protein